MQFGSILCIRSKTELDFLVYSIDRYLNLNAPFMEMGGGGGDFLTNQHVMTGGQGGRGILRLKNNKRNPCEHCKHLPF